MKVVLTMIDTAGIQDYVFASNRLRENIGASYLVEQATREWVCDELKKLGGHNIKEENLRKDEVDRIDRNKLIEDDGQVSELIYAGGGKAAILFRAPDGSGEGALGNSRRFARNLSSAVLEGAPGLELVIAHNEPFDWERQAGDLSEKIKELSDGRLAEKKRTRQATPTPLLGLGVTAECEATGLVATRQTTKKQEPEPRLVSRETIKKLDARDDADERLQKLFAKVEKLNEFEFSAELDHLGRIGGEESYIAVVHIDGNGMGEVIKDYVSVAKDNREYIERMRDFSEGVERASRAALVKTLITLRSHIEPDRDPKTRRTIQLVTEGPPESVPEPRRTNSQQKRIRLFHEEKEKRPGAKPCWPFRPLVFGGDDVTFVCNGQLGLSLATIYMNAFTAETRDLMKDSPHKEIHTGAGVCIVKVHYPFRRAYDLSERLTGSAKKYLKSDKLAASAIDWHISSTGLSGTLSAIREREYEVYLPELKDQKETPTLLMRPVLMRHDSEWRTWENFNHFVATLNYDNRWAEHRNKVKSLREALRKGGPAVKEFLALNKLTGEDESQNKTDETLLPKLLKDQGRRLHEVGWESGRCVYFDAIEAMDHHFLLREAADAN